MLPLVYIVEDDSAVRDALVWLLHRSSYQVEAYASPSELLDAYDLSKTGCLVLDLQLPEMSGIELRTELLRRGCQLPFIIISGHGEVSDATKAMHLGAVDFLEKPLDRNVFLNRVSQAIKRDAQRRKLQVDREDVQARLDSLTPREHEVLKLVVAGELTKNIARELGISIKTIETHRSNITRKMKVEGAVQLVRLLTLHSAPTTDQSRIADRSESTALRSFSTDLEE